MKRNLLLTFAWVILGALPVLWFVACGGDDEGSGTALPGLATDGPAAPSAEASPTAPAPTAQPGTQPLTYRPGRNDYTITVDGQRRQYIVHVPGLNDPRVASPVVFMFHGTSQNGELFWENSGWKEKGEAENFITVFPTSLRYHIVEEGRTTTKWNHAGLVNLVAPGTTLYDDTKLVDAIIEKLGATFALDRDRIFASGFSNGGQFVTSRLLPEMADVFAAGTSSGSGFLEPDAALHTSPETAKRSLYIVMGTNDDKIVPPAVEKGALTLPLSIRPEAYLEQPLFKGRLLGWTSILNLSPDYTVEYERVGLPNSTATWTTSTAGADNELKFRLVQGMAHIYPGPDDRARIGFTNADIFWEFFTEHPMEG